ncbi:MAG TPA: ATP-dependent helicase C-terminal domain-containing protein [Methylomirabilota bacterium]|nr:ATP-dependent helicase C-terminal domain-containing protein [Methylomirabilota bacterium]
MDASLPIHRIRDGIVGALITGNRLVVVAPTGSGKTTQVPQMVLDAGLAGQDRIVILQPRRVAARTVAARVAWERKGRLGGEVGYQVRFEDHTSLGTRICFITEGILLRWLQEDPELRGIRVLIFDEFHERNLLSDVALALAREIQRVHRPDLKIVVMSATLDAEPVAAYLDNCPVLQSECSMFPVEVRYPEHGDRRPITEQAADAVETILQSGEAGDILVFMPGMGEIQSTLNALRTLRAPERLALIPLHGELPPEEQDRAFQPHPGRKIVVATNVAETSVTIDGIRHVVDSGLARIARYDAERGIGTLGIEEISRASADQRKGRAGRTAPGTCHRLWTESGHLNRPERHTPEIQRSDLAEVVLLLHSLGIRNAAAFDWLDKPDPQAVERAEILLRTLGALQPRAPQQAPQGNDSSAGRTIGGASDDHAAAPSARAHDDLTPVGRRMLRLPMHPRFARMLVEASRHQCVPAAAMCAALVSGRDLMMRLGRDDKSTAGARELFEGSAQSDFHTLMRACQFAKNRGYSVEACRRYGINARAAREVEQTFQQFLQVARREGLLNSSTPEVEPAADEGDALLRSIMTGFIDQLCVRRDQGTLECHLTGARTGTLMRESVVQNSPLFVAASIREVPSRGRGTITLLGLASHVSREWILETFPDRLHTTLEHLFDRGHRRVAALKVERFEDLIMAHEHQREPDPAAAGHCLADAWNRGWFELPKFDHDIRQFIARCHLVAAAMPDIEFPRFDRARLVDCLGRAFAGLTLAKEAQAVPLREAVIGELAPEQREWLDELAPRSIPWPDDRKVKLLFPEPTGEEEDGPAEPEAQVKLHECFSLRSHPVICEGRVPVRLWLCAPDGKRLDSTTDWPVFRKTQYPRLKSTLLKKYPGVGWL